MLAKSKSILIRDLRSAVWSIRPLHMRRSLCHTRLSHSRRSPTRLLISPMGLPRFSCGWRLIQESVTVMDPALEGSSEPLVKVRMNRALTRRMRWLMKRGRVQRSGGLRVCSAAAEARCNLSPTQFIEYNIRVNGLSRVLAYGLNRGGRIPNRGGVLSLGVAGICAAPLSPD